MSEAVQVGVLSALAALLAVFIERLFEERRRKSEETRWYADRLLVRKIDAISDLHSQLIDWQWSIQLASANPPRTLEEFKDRLQTRQDAYRRAMVLANVYLQEDIDQVVRKAYAAFSAATQAMWFWLPDEVIPHVNKGSYDEDTKRV